MTATNFTKEDVIDAFKSLPAIVQKTITDSKWENILQQIALKNKLMLDQVKILEDKIVLVMVGISSVEDFINVLKSEVTPDKVNLGNLIQDIDSLIFEPLRNQMIKNTNEPINNQGGAALIKQTDEAPANTTEAADLLTYTKPDIESRDDILKQIEDPSEIPVASVMPTPKTAPINAPVPSVSQTAPAPSTLVSSTPKIDPYREPIE